MQPCKLALQQRVLGPGPSPSRSWDGRLQSQSCPRCPRSPRAAPACHVREGADAARRVPDVPHFDVRRGHGEHQSRVAAVLDGNHVVRVTLEGSDFLARHQVPHFAAPVCGRRNVPKSVRLGRGGWSLGGNTPPEHWLPPPTVPEEGSQPQHQGIAGQGSALRAGDRPRRNHPMVAGTSRIPPRQPAPTAPAGQQPPRPPCPPRTFGPGEEQLVGGIQAEHRLGVSFCHGDALQRGCPGILGATHRVNDAPWWERKKQRGGGGVERHRTAQPQGHERARSASPPAPSTAWQCHGPLHLHPARLSKGLCGNPGDPPRSSPCLLPLPHQYRLGKRGLSRGLCYPAEPLTPGQRRPKEPGDPAHRFSGQSGTNRPEALLG